MTESEEKPVRRRKSSKADKREALRLPVYRPDGTKSGDEVDLKSEIFQAPVNERLLNIVFTSYARNQRRGTSDTKERAEVRGGGRKPWRQKGTGRARAGSTRSPIWRGGGTTFGPHPRDYSVHIPKELKRKALISVLSLKCKEENIMVVADTAVSQPKTKELYQMIKSLKLDGSRTLCIVPAIDENLKRASANLDRIFSLEPASDFNAYDVLRRKKLLLDKQAIPLIEKRILGQGTIADNGHSRKAEEKVGV